MPRYCPSRPSPDIDGQLNSSTCNSGYPDRNRKRKGYGEQNAELFRPRHRNSVSYRKYADFL